MQNGKYAFNPQMEWNGGGLASTVSDLSLWVKLLYSGNVLKPETKKMLLTPAPYKTTLFENAAYGLGCIMGETDGIKHLGHTGFVPGYITIVQFIPKYDLSIAFQFNSDKLHGDLSKLIFNKLKNIIIENGRH